MRALLSLVAGGPGRVATTAAAIVVIVFVLAGHGWDLVRASWFALIFAGAFAFAVLAMIGAATGVADGDSPVPAPGQADQ
ncbi:hypothetical protein [Methylobacterium sp. WCS2018Hpa-22]|uniref:hypothetical protein n=1 Tax=Methylobacterium sp. WCS2018Hpa-22 TaxID=3073633 RepID=UPI00288B3B1A|nr:hypothetical protein [Methylobacterium sp. WCS2018Hpa-22]